MRSAKALAAFAWSPAATWPYTCIVKAPEACPNLSWTRGFHCASLPGGYQAVIERCFTSVLRYHRLQVPHKAVEIRSVGLFGT